MFIVRLYEWCPRARGHHFTFYCEARVHYNINHHVFCYPSFYSQIDISHPFFWEDANGEPPPPMTSITADDVMKSVWCPREKPLLKHCVNYLKSIDAPHVIWPEHCLIGTDGHNVERNINEALQNWSALTGKNVRHTTC